MCRTRVLALFITLFLTVEGSFVKIENNGYSGLLVGFSPTVNYSYGMDLLLKLKDMYNEASKILYEITGKRAYFKEIIFLIPKTWSPRSQWLRENEVSQLTNWERLHDADVWVESTGGVFGDVPYTIQTTECGEQGLRIHLTEGFLKSKSVADQQKGKQFILEWAKYRYGIYDERGFPDDPMYPLYYSIPKVNSVDDIRVTSCSNIELKLGDSCLIEMDYLKGRPRNSRCRPDIINEQDATSSFMYSSKLKSFCGDDDGHKHNPNAPTKHNLLCKEKSTWNVIMQHQDFVNGINSASPNVDPPLTAFRYVQERQLRLVLTLDRSNYITPKMKQLFSRTITKFLSFAVPENSLVGSVHFGSVNDLLKIQVKELTEVKKFAKFTTFQSSKDPGKPCVICALNQAAQVLKRDRVSEGGKIVVVTKGNLDPDELSNITSIIQEYKVRLYIVLYPVTHDQPSEQLEKIVAKTDGSVQYVHDDIPETEELLYEALRSSIRDETRGTFDDNILLTETMFQNNDIVFNFPIDYTTGREFYLLCSTEDLENIEQPSLLLRSPNNDYGIAGFESIENAYYVTIPKAEAGEYTFEVKTPYLYKEPVHIRVIAKENDVHSGIIVKCWLNTRDQIVNPASRAVILYASVFSGPYPVRGAKVEVTLLHFEQQTPQPYTFELYDNGLGDPDVTKDDGIYSRYLIEFADEGRYILTVSVNDNNENAEILKGQNSDNQCCGSFVPPIGALKTGSFQRKYVFGSFYVSKSGPVSYPPNRITDLLLTKIEENYVDSFDTWNVKLTFQFTSTGANQYTMKYFKERNHALRYFESYGRNLDFWEMGIVNPSDYGTVQSIRIEMSVNELMSFRAPQDIIFFSMKASSSNVSSETSNVVEVFLPIPEPPVEVSSPDPSTESDPNKESIIDDQQKPAMSSAKIGLIAGLTCGIFVIIIVIVIIAFLLTRKRKSKKNHYSNKRDIKKISSEDLEDITTKRPEESMDPHLSPIQSWPADVLMNHYDKVREAKQNHCSPPIMKIEDVLDSCSTASAQSLQSNPIYDTEEEKNYNIKYNPYINTLPTAPLSSSTSSLSRSVTQV